MSDPFRGTGLPCPECGVPMWRVGVLADRWQCESYYCPAAKARRNSTRARSRRAGEVRRPPRNSRPPAGTCSLCGDPVVKPRVSWCGDYCVQVWWLATTPADQKAQLRFVFPGCWQCGIPEVDLERVGEVQIALEVDHVRPLWSLDEQERTEIRWWLPANLQLLCTGPAGCHTAKTAREATERAARKVLDSPVQ